MKKNIDIDDRILFKLKILSAFEDMSVKALMEKAVSFYVEHKEKEKFDRLSQEEKEDVGLLALMMEADSDELATEEEVMDILRS